MRYNFNINECENYVNSDDIVSVVCGEWKESNIPCEDYICSVCGGANWYYGSNGMGTHSRYCHNCGAKMNRGEK